MSIEIGTLLVHSPNVCGGRVRIDGTRITVNQIVTLYKKGDSPEDIVEYYVHLTLAQVHAALAYYHANQQEIENSLVVEEKEAEHFEKKYSQGKKEL